MTMKYKITVTVEVESSWDLAALLGEINETADHNTKGRYNVKTAEILKDPAKSGKIQHFPEVSA